MSKRHLISETFFLIMIIIGIAFQITIEILYYQADINTFDILILNWKGGPIKSLSTFNKDSTINNCPENTNILSNQKWKGTYPGIIDYFGNIVISNKLSNDNTNFIPKIEEQITNKWRNQFICGTRMRYNSYFDLHIAPWGKCPKPLESCGKIDSFGNSLCLNDLRDCPINYMTYYSNKILEEDSHFLHFSDGYIYYSNENTSGGLASSFILKDILFSENTPCINTNYIETKNERHKLDHYYSKSKCPFLKINTDYLSIDSYSQKQFLEENSVLKKIYQLPNVKHINMKTKINFFIRSYIGLNYACFERLTDKANVLNHLPAIQNEMNKSFNWNTFTILIDIIFLLLFIVKYFVILSKKYNKKSKKKPKYVKPLLMIMIVFSYIFTVIVFSSLSFYQIMDILLDKTCIDENTHLLLNPTLLKLNLIKTFAISNIVIKGVVTLKYGILTAIKYAS